MSNPQYPNSGEPELQDLKGQLWRCTQHCWIDTCIKGRAFRLYGPDNKLSAYLETGGRLHVLPGYVCDGSSIPLLGRWIDYRTSAWPGLTHDINYEAERTGALGPEDRPMLDALYRDMLHAFGAFWITSRLCFIGLRLFGGGSAKRNAGAEYARRKP